MAHSNRRADTPRGLSLMSGRPAPGRAPAPQPGRRQVLGRALALGALALPALALAACGGEAPPQGPVFTQPRFPPTNPVWLHAKVLEVQDNYLPPLKAPNIEAELPVSLGDTALLWARVRLRASGRGGNTARVTVTRAAVTETPLPRTGGVSGLFTRDQVSRFDTDLIGELTITDHTGERIGYAQSRVTRGLSIPEGTTANERMTVLNALVNDTATAWGRAMEAKIHSDLNRFVAYPPDN